jgi:hypothetical protein
MIPCDKIPKINEVPFTMGDLYLYTLELMGLYQECALSLDALIEVLKVENK